MHIPDSGWAFLIPNQFGVAIYKSLFALQWALIMPE